MSKKAWNDTKALAWTILPTCALTFYLEWVFAHLISADQINTLTVVLAALSAMLTALGIGVGLLAFWGYTSIREHATEKAEKAARETAEKVASKTATLVAARTAETLLHQATGTNEDYGAAAGGTDDGQAAR